MNTFYIWRICIFLMVVWVVLQVFWPACLVLSQSLITEQLHQFTTNIHSQTAFRYTHKSTTVTFDMGSVLVNPFFQMGLRLVHKQLR
jgi:nucleoside recognition membrane protein YjiH